MKHQCPCGKEYALAPQLNGRRFRCSCGRILTIGTREVFEPPASTRHSARSDAPKAANAAPTRPSEPLAVLTGVGLIFLWIWSADSSTPPPRSTQPLRAPSSMAASASAAPTPTAAARCATEDAQRPASGQELSRFSRRGLGRLSIDNGSSYDAVAVLVDVQSGRPYRAIYVRSREVGVFTKVAQGAYRLQFQTGSRWLLDRTFCVPISASEFSDYLVFTEKPEYDGTVYDDMSITLHTVSGGNARTSSLGNTPLQLPPP